MPAKNGFSLGIVARNFLFNTIWMLKPVTGKPVSLWEHFKRSGTIFGELSAEGSGRLE